MSTELTGLENLVGKKVFIRTVTLYYSGFLESISGNFLNLSSSAWIANTGRFADSLISGNFSEVEPMGKTAVNINAIVDVTEVSFKLPTVQK